MTSRSTCPPLDGRSLTGGLWLALIVFAAGASVTLGQDGRQPPSHSDSQAAGASGATAPAPPTSAQTGNDTQLGSSAAAGVASQEEMTSRESTPTFQVRANMVLVRVVVRDSSRKSIGTLNRDDFEIFDNHRQQIISN